MGNELVVSTGGAVTVPSTGTAVAVGEHLGDISRDTGPANTRQIAAGSQRIANLRHKMLRDMVIEGIGEQVIERCLPVLQDCAPALLAALETSNRQEQERLTHALRDELVSKGLLSLEQIERIRPILQDYDAQSEHALVRPGTFTTHNRGELIDEMRELDSMMADRRSEYWRGPDANRLQRRWRELHDLGVRADDERSIADVDLERRIEEIEKWMSARKDTLEYKRYYDNLGVQKEYHQLLQRRRQ